MKTDVSVFSDEAYGTSEGFFEGGIMNSCEKFASVFEHLDKSHVFSLLLTFSSCLGGKRT